MTSRPAIHQVLPMLHRRDAVGEHSIELQRHLLAAGFESEILVDKVDPETADLTHRFEDRVRGLAADDVLVYQFATSSVLARALAADPRRVVVNYHSLTPTECFTPWDEHIAHLQEAALDELRALAPTATLGIAVSRFDEAELRAAGCARTETIPVLNADRRMPAPDPDELRRLSEFAGQRPLWLTVGRMAPNKSVESVVAALWWAHRSGGPDGPRLSVVGRAATPAYARAVREYVDRLGLAGEVRFRTSLTDAELAAHYERADLYVGLSVHEGFGVPFVEAMRAGVPIVALDAAAASETLGGYGTLVADRRPSVVAAAAQSVTVGPPGEPSEREARRDAMRDRGARQVAALGLATAADRMVAVLTELAGERSPVPEDVLEAPSVAGEAS